VNQPILVRIVPGFAYNPIPPPEFLLLAKPHAEADRLADKLIEIQVIFL